MNITIKEWATLVLIISTIAGVVAKFAAMQTRVDDLEADMHGSTLDRFYGHQGQALEKRIDKLENDLPPEWLLEDIRDIRNECRLKANRCDKRLDTVEKYMRDSFNWNGK